MPIFPVIRVLDQRPVPASGPWNMACDEALLQTLTDDSAPLLRFYHWDQPTLSYGYFLKLDDALAAAQPGEALIRRWTGGGLVHHGQDFTWSLLVPRAHSFAQMKPAESYGHLHQAVAEALQNVGISGAEVVPATAPAPRGGLCFEAPAPGDLIFKNRKIAGAGQRRTRHGLLHQATLLVPGLVLADDFANLLVHCVAAEIVPYSLPPDLVLPVGRYADPHWNPRL